MDDRVSGNDGKALRRCDSIGSAAIKVTVSNPDPAAAVEVQHTSGAVSLARCVPCREIGEMQIVTAVCSQDIGIARFCHDAAALGVASLQPEPRNVSNHKLVSVISVYPMPVFSRVQISVALGFCQVVYAVFQSDHTIRSDRFQQFIHRADLENRIRSHTVLCGKFCRSFGMGVRNKPAPEPAYHQKQRQKQGKQPLAQTVRTTILHDLLRPFCDK